ncbi:MAG TPA: beta-L-arabinofuranosidase domain-containing protein [Microlunatus sp.]|nr:beta-L-arabinofuranosidase domain-containing protein [Microlunatus sp.]
MSLLSPTRSENAEAAAPRADGPVAPRATTARRPLPSTAAVLSGGLLHRLQTMNAVTSIPRGAEHLEREGAWLNFENVTNLEESTAHHGPCFEDGEAYKWLEAVAWEAGRTGERRLSDWLTSYSATIAAAQDDDGYVNTFVQSGGRSSRYEQLAWDHEIFNMAALIQSAIAQFRATGLSDLLRVAVKAADHLDATFGPGKSAGTCGHPLIEMALVELYRTTGDVRYLELARHLVEVRGHDILDPSHRFGDDYHSDRVPVRETVVPEGHAVRAIYLAAGATDLAIETGDMDLLAALKRQWQNMADQKMYVTGGLGARWEGEAFGDPYELPSDRAYAETCAAIAGIQWNWRLLLATGEVKYADLMERQLYNAVLPGISWDGSAYFYANALQVHTGAVAIDTRMAAGGRQHWFGCSCCPTNIMRTLASVPSYLATHTGDALQLQLLTSATLGADLAAGRLELEVRTDYPFDGRVTIMIVSAPEQETAVEIRIPAWADQASAVGPQGSLSPVAGSYLRVPGRFRPGDRIDLDLAIRPRLTVGHHRVDASRGCVAIERGPLVYAVEQVDQVEGALVDDLALDGARISDEFVPDLLGGTPTVSASGVVLGGDERPVTVRAVPYFLWANREVGAMKVWLPMVQGMI